MKKPHGMPRVAWDGYVVASDQAKINIESRADARVVQTVGFAKASAGFHAPDGVLNGEEYCAAVDLSVRGLTHTQIATWLEELCRAGFCGWFRDWPGNKHIHANYAGVPMKPQLRAQCRDFFAGRNGLAGHADEEFWTASPELRKIPRRMFNELLRGKIVSSPALESKEPEEKPLTYALYLNKKLLLWMPVIDGVALAPVRAWGTALGFDVNWVPSKKQVQFNGRDVPIPIISIAGVGHAPVRKLAEYSGLQVKFDARKRSVVIERTGRATR